MESLDIPFNFSQPVRLINQKKQEFILWFEPAVEPKEIYQSLNFRKQFLQNMLLLTPEDKFYEMLQAFDFPAKLIKVDPGGNLCQIVYVKKTDLVYSCETINLEGRGFYLLVNTDFFELFGLVLNESQAFLVSEPVENLAADSLREPLEREKSAGEIVDAILSQQNGTGLRSLVPYAYVWYHDLLFMVEQMDIPISMEPGRVNKAMYQASLVIEDKGLNPVYRKAAYPSMYYADGFLKITADDTWYGMENYGRFARHNIRRPHKSPESLTIYPN